MDYNCLDIGLELKNSSSFRLINRTCSWMNAVFTCPTLILNAALLVAFATSREKRSACILLLTNLTVSDLLNGSVNMPMFFFVYRKFSEGSYPCAVADYAIPLFIVFNVASYATVALISLERYTRIFFPFHHNSRFSVQNVVIFIGLSWLFAFAVTITPIVIVRNEAFQGVVSAIIIAGIVINFFCYFRILAKARRVRFEIHDIAARFGHESLTPSDRRHVRVGGLIFLSMIICFLPLLAVNLDFAIRPYKSKIKDARCLAWTLGMANSFINPLITCSFCPAIRQKFLRILTCRVFCRKTDQ